MLLFLRTWIFFCATLTAGGWLLSVAGFLNRAGYCGLLAVFFLFLQRFLRTEDFHVQTSKWLRRFSRGAPMFYGLLAGVCLLGAFLYLPVNVDGYSYRIPRVLHWLFAGRWHWIHSADIRLNVVAPGFDWLSAPLLLFFKTERAIPVINVISFLLLPGGVFMVLHRVGLRKRVAWWWMWIIPAGFCYCMQAGSIANDMYAAVFTLSAIGFALRANESRKVVDLWTSGLALALATSAKQTNLPFILPWLIAAAPSVDLLRVRVMRSAGIVLLAIFASIIPISLLNVRNGFPWQGFLPGKDFAPSNPFWGIIGNSFWIPFSNLQPPIVPWAGQWNAWREGFLATDFGAHFRSFEVFLYLNRAAAEQYSGVGCTVFLLLVGSWLASKVISTGASRSGTSFYSRLIRLSVWFGFFVFMAKVGINQCPRYLASYYPFLAASFLLGSGESRLVRKRWWQWSSMGVMMVSVVLIVLSRQRPVFPAQTISHLLERHGGGKSFLQKVANSYTFAESLRTELEPFLKQIPTDQAKIGYAVRAGDKEPWLWKPYFSREVKRVLNTDSPESAREMGIRYVVVDPSALKPVYDPAMVVEARSPGSEIKGIEEWMHMYDAEEVANVNARVTPDAAPQKLYLVRFRPK